MALHTKCIRTVPNCCCVCAKSCKSSGEGGGSLTNGEWLKGFGSRRRKTPPKLIISASSPYCVLRQRFSSMPFPNGCVPTWQRTPTSSVQKGDISGMSGCLKHTSVVTQLIWEARENKGNLSVLWLDLVNAFGSIPHNKLVQLTLSKHHVPTTQHNH